MSLRYLFPCPECGHSVELVATQAGQQVVCSGCQHVFEAPRLGEMRQLPKVGNESAKPTYSPLKRFLFAGGLALFVVLGLSGLGLYQYASSMIIELNLEESFVGWNQHVDDMSPDDLWQEWNAMDVKAGLGQWEEQVFARYETQGKILQTMAVALLGLAGLGALMMISSLFVRGK